MKKIVLLIACVSALTAGYSQNLYKAVEGDISFFSKTPMEDIDAVNENVKALINTNTGDVAFIATNVGFHFEKPQRTYPASARSRFLTEVTALSCVCERSI